MTDVEFKGWPHVIRCQQFSREWLEEVLFPEARKMKEVFIKGGDKTLDGKSMMTFFFQPSTRTHCSFVTAMRALGGDVRFTSDNAAEFSSISKGESLAHTIRVLNRYRPDVMVMRFKNDGDAAIAAANSPHAVIINGGDGPGQHPTQGFLDWFTIRERFGRVDGLTIGLVGDLLKGRAVRSLAYILSWYKVRLVLISSAASRMKDDVKQHFREHNIWFVESNDITRVAPMLDALYVTRNQKEQKKPESCANNLPGVEAPILSWEDRQAVDSEVVGLMKKEAVILHPLPIDSAVQEINTEVENDPRVICFDEEVDAGIYTRMALLKIILLGKARQATVS